MSLGVFFSYVVRFEINNMALNRLLRICLKCGVDFNLSRSGKCTSCILRLQNYSTAKNKRNETPVKYTSNTASKVLIAENLDLVRKSDMPWFQPYVVAGSVMVFLIYFCILREESDIDEMLKGNPEYKTDYANYIDLQLKLQYCKQNNLPTAAVAAKLEEYRIKLDLPEA